MAEVDRGASVVIEITCTKRAPFGTTWDLFDPTTPKISIYSATDVAMVTDAVPTKSATGKYYYICQTLTTWETGAYYSKVTGVDGTYNEVDVTSSVFELV